MIQALIIGQTPVGKVDEIMGPLNNVYFSVKPQEGIKADSFKAGDKFFIAVDKLLPKEKYAHSMADGEIRDNANSIFLQILAKAQGCRSQTTKGR